MEVLTKHELKFRKREIIEKIKKGAVFIHPTDTIYGLGCNATNEKAVKKIRKLKDRYTNPFSVWAPSKKWIKQNLQETSALNKWLKELPGPYTLITKASTTNTLAPNVNPQNKTLGVRMPDHWFHQLIEELNLPIVTTSANKTGKEFMTSLDNLDPEIRRNADFMIYEGEKKARPSKLVNLVEEEKIVER